MPATLTQLAALDNVWNRSGYTQSVTGHGRQHRKAPEPWHNRPCVTMGLTVLLV